MFRELPAGSTGLLWISCGFQSSRLTKWNSMKMAKIHQVKHVDINQAPVNQPMNQNSLTLRSFTELLLPIVGRRWPLAMIATREKNKWFCPFIKPFARWHFFVGSNPGSNPVAQCPIQSRLTCCTSPSVPTSESSCSTTSVTTVTTGHTATRMWVSSPKREPPNLEGRGLWICWVKNNASGRLVIFKALVEPGS